MLTTFADGVVAQRARRHERQLDDEGLARSGRAWDPGARPR